MDIVVNEWLPEYFRPEATREEKLQLQAFLQRFIERNDCMVVKEPSPFLSKILQYANAYQQQYEIVTPIRNFIKIVLEDSLRCRRVRQDEIGELPTSVTEILSRPNPASDRYLFEAATSIEHQKIIVTTDARLQAHFEDEFWCEVELLSDFLETY